MVQLYIRFPRAASEPDLVLRAFRKTARLAPGDTAEVCLTLEPDDLAVWRAAGVAQREGGWHALTGTFTILVGASSLDHRLQADILRTA